MMWLVETLESHGTRVARSQERVESPAGPSHLHLQILQASVQSKNRRIPSRVTYLTVSAVGFLSLPRLRDLSPLKTQRSSCGREWLTMVLTWRCLPATPAAIATERVLKLAVQQDLYPTSRLSLMGPNLTEAPRARKKSSLDEKRERRMAELVVNE